MEEVTKEVEKKEERGVLEDGRLAWGDTAGKQIAMAKSLLKSGMLPSQYETAEQVLVAKQYAHELGLPNVLLALKNIAVIKGTPSIFGDLPLGIVRNKGHIKTFEEFLFDEGYKKISFENKNLHVKPFGAVCRSERIDGNSAEGSYTMEDAKKAGLLGSIAWQKYPERMLKYRARGIVLKDLYSDDLANIAIGEYQHNVVYESAGVDYTVNEDGTQEPEVSPEKLAIIETINGQVEYLQEEYNWNDAKVLQFTGDVLQSTDFNTADIKDLEKLAKAIENEIALIENVEGEENE